MANPTLVVITDRNDLDEQLFGTFATNCELLRLQARLARIPRLVVDELGYVPFSKTGAERLFEIFSQRYEQGSILANHTHGFAHKIGFP